MNRTEHLLMILAEECAEVAQRVSKALRFGLDEVQPGQQLTNEQRIWGEMNDLAGVGEMLIAARGAGGFCRDAVEAKKAKVERYLSYSAECGTLGDSRATDAQVMEWAERHDLNRTPDELRCIFDDAATLTPNV